MAACASAPGETGVPGRLHILLVDDDWLGQSISAAILEELGYRVTMAGSGAEALARWEDAGCDLILMDVQMPEMDGLEATRRIRQREASGGGRVPVIALTADTGDGDRQACLDAGMDDHVPKPVEAAVVQEAIDRLRAGAGSAIGESAHVEAAPAEAAASADGEVAGALARLGFEPLPEEDPATTTEIPAEMLARLEDDVARTQADVVLDPEALERLRELEQRGALSVARILSAFADNGEQILADLRADLAVGRVADLRRAAHTLKGNARDVGAHRLANHCERLEGMARNGALEGAGELLEHIELAWAEACAALGRRASPGSGTTP